MLQPIENRLFAAKGRIQDNIVIVGFPDAAVKESKERVSTAFTNSDFKFPMGRKTINLARADLRALVSGLPNLEAFHNPVLESERWTVPPRFPAPDRFWVDPDFFSKLFARFPHLDAVVNDLLANVGWGLG